MNDIFLHGSAISCILIPKKIKKHPLTLFTQLHVHALVDIHITIMRVQSLCLYIVVLVTLSVTNSLQIRVLTGLTMRGQANQPDFTDQKLVINSNNRYVYPVQQTPEYNVYKIPPMLYNRNFIEIVSNNYVYPLLIVDQKANGPASYQLVHPFTRQIIEPVSEPIYLKPFDRIQYLVEQAPFSISSFLFSGTGLFLVGGAFLYLCYKSVMPKLEEAQMAPESASSANQ